MTLIELFEILPAQTQYLSLPTLPSYSTDRFKGIIYSYPSLAQILSLFGLADDFLYSLYSNYCIQYQHCVIGLFILKVRK